MVCFRTAAGVADPRTARLSGNFLKIGVIVGLALGIVVLNPD